MDRAVGVWTKALLIGDDLLCWESPQTGAIRLEPKAPATGRAETTGVGARHGGRVGRAFSRVFPAASEMASLLTARGTDASVERYQAGVGVDHGVSVSRGVEGGGWSLTVGEPQSDGAG